MSKEWETRYQQGDTPWDKGAASPPLVDWLRSQSMTGSVLVPGCGAGHDVRILAAQGAAVTGLDVAPSAVRLAQQHPVVRNETYVEADLFNLPEAFHGAFDWVFEHTCFCAIPPSRRVDYVAAANLALKPEGRLLGVFYLESGWDHPDEGPPFGVKIDALRDFFTPHFHWQQDLVPQSAYEGRHGRELLVEMQKTS